MTNERGVAPAAVWELGPYHADHEVFASLPVDPAGPGAQAEFERVRPSSYDGPAVPVESEVTGSLGALGAALIAPSDDGAARRLILGEFVGRQLLGVDRRQLVQRRGGEQWTWCRTPLGASPPGADRHRRRPCGRLGVLTLGYAEGLDSPPPLLVFLHGLGANGDRDAELDEVLETAIPRMIENDDWPDDRPFVVLSPQYCGELCIGPGNIEAFIAWAVQQYAIDPSRVYLTAVSCGAYGGWRYLAQVPDSQIAATVLIAGDGRSPFNAAGCDLARVPIWAFHGDADGVVPVEGTIQPVEGLLACEPQPDVELTIYPGVGHNSWSRTYDGSAGHDVFGWMLEHVANRG